MIERIQTLTDSKVLLISDNQKYAALVAPEDIQINGKVIWFGAGN